LQESLRRVDLACNGLNFKHNKSMKDEAVVFKQNPNSEENGEVMPGMYFLGKNGGLVKDIKEARIWTADEAEKFCSRRSFDWMMKHY
jgi:hypothetical protein